MRRSEPYAFWVFFPVPRFVKDTKANATANSVSLYSLPVNNIARYYSVISAKMICCYGYDEA